MAQSTEATPIVDMQDIKKHFGAVQALRGIDLALQHNEVLGLMGDNAAGKSTLMKVLSGAYIPDGGRILLDGQEVQFASPMDARRTGIEMVYQDYALSNNLDVAANVFMQVHKFDEGWEWIAYADDYEDCLRGRSHDPGFAKDECVEKIHKIMTKTIAACES